LFVVVISEQSPRLEAWETSLIPHTAGAFPILVPLLSYDGMGRGLRSKCAKTDWPCRQQTHLSQFVAV